MASLVDPLCTIYPKCRVSADRLTGANHFPVSNGNCSRLSTGMSQRKKYKRFFCKSCNRPDVHRPMKWSMKLVAGSVLSLGLLAIFRPHQCYVCSTARLPFTLPTANINWSRMNPLSHASKRRRLRRQYRADCRAAAAATSRRLSSNRG